MVKGEKKRPSRFPIPLSIGKEDEETTQEDRAELPPQVKGGGKVVSEGEGRDVRQRRSILPVRREGGEGARSQKRE